MGKGYAEGSAVEERQAALERGVRLVFADNEVVPLPGEPELDELFRGLVPSEVRA